MRAAALLLAVAMASPAVAQGTAAESRFNIDSPGWRKTETTPGGPRVWGSTHPVPDPPRVVTEIVEVERPVYVPVPEPVIGYYPVRVPIFRPRPLPRPPLPSRKEREQTQQFRR